MTDTRRRGFTLVELLVVISIIATLMGLLLPAVQSVREGGRRNTCSNHLYQLGKAAMQYDSERGSLPGWRNPHPNALGTVQPSWPVPLMPMLERRDIYNTWQQVTGLPTAAPHISMFTCPTSPPDSTTTPVLAYAGNAGTGAVTSTQQWKGDGVMFDAVGGSGLTGARIGIDFISQKDGTSNTLLFAEKCGSLTIQVEWDERQLQSLAGGYTRPSSAPTSNVVTNPPIFGIASDYNAAYITKVINSTAAPSANNPSYAVHPSSNHAGGVMVTFCDGHTKFIKDSLAAPVYAQLITSDSTWDTIPAPAGYKSNSARMRTTWLPIQTPLNESSY